MAKLAIFKAPGLLISLFHDYNVGATMVDLKVPGAVLISASSYIISWSEK